MSVRVLCVGIACVDIVLDVDEYAREDSQVRVNQVRMTRGGNASNTLTVLSQLGVKASFLGTLGDAEIDPGTQFILKDFARLGIDSSLAVCVPKCVTPTSYIPSSARTGSRTIFHHRNLPELSAEKFRGIFARACQESHPWDWIHFEGRNCVEVVQCLQLIQQFNEGLFGSPVSESKIIISVELEKGNRPNIELLVPYADVLFVSHEFAATHMFSTPEVQIQALVSGKFGQLKPNAKISVTWGEDGAVVYDCATREMEKIASFPPERVVDTIGAGDTYNAAFLAALLREKSLREAATEACQLAGKKVGREGLENLL
eukprot:c4449_g1_i2.p1 GENE.c4449_g1_i2~~c4449_g1_i2.p1  ORF type:complete len:327 (+),score=81.98 c4449_g1_i2:34-981(+)